MHILLLASVLALVASQHKQPEPSSAPKRGDTIVVQGCVSGGTFVSSQAETRDSTGLYSGALTFRLSGDKKLIKQIKKEHDGHADVLTGVLKSDLNRHVPRGKVVGNTRITIGMGEPARPDTQAVQYMPVLQVKQIEHPGASCR